MATIEFVCTPTPRQPVARSKRATTVRRRNNASQLGHPTMRNPNSTNKPPPTKQLTIPPGGGTSRPAGPSKSGDNNVEMGDVVNVADTAGAVQITICNDIKEPETIVMRPANTANSSINNNNDNNNIQDHIMRTNHYYHGNSKSSNPRSNDNKNNDETYTDHLTAARTPTQPHTNVSYKTTPSADRNTVNKTYDK